MIFAVLRLIHVGRKQETAVNGKALHDGEPLGPFYPLEGQGVSVSTLGR